MAYIRYSIKYGGVLKYANSKANSIDIQYPKGTTKQTISTTTSKNMDCDGCVMTGDVKIGDKDIYCKGKLMNGDLDIDAKVTGGSNYDVITANGSWVVPPGVTSLTIFCVGGGGAGGLSGGYHSSSSDGIQSVGQAGGGGGGYTKQVSNIAVTPGESLSCTIGAGGAVGSFADAQSWDSYDEYYRYYNTVNAGGRGGTTSVKRGNAVLCSADGGYAGGVAKVTSLAYGGGTNGGNGGSGGGAGASSGRYSASYYNGANGGTNGGNGGASPVSGGTAGRGQGTSTAFNGVTYAGGGAAGDYEAFTDAQDSYPRVNPGTGGATGGGNGGNNDGANGYGGGGGGYSRTPGMQTSFTPSNRGGNGVIVFKW